MKKIIEMLNEEFAGEKRSRLLNYLNDCADKYFERNNIEYNYILGKYTKYTNTPLIELIDMIDNENDLKMVYWEIKDRFCIRHYRPNYIYTAINDDGNRIVADNGISIAKKIGVSYGVVMYNVNRNYVVNGYRIFRKFNGSRKLKSAK